MKVLLLRGSPHITLIRDSLSSQIEKDLSKYESHIKTDKKMASKDVRIPEMYLRKIEAAIGSTIDPSEESMFSSFQEVDEITKSRARDIYYNLDELRAESYLKYVLSEKLDRSHIFSFLIDVIIGGMDLDEWAREELSSSSRD
ncbi:hypothetical protein [Hahella chejuensis]|nr:hypothetical protein [Hahella chejuensis]